MKRFAINLLATACCIGGVAMAAGAAPMAQVTDTDMSLWRSILAQPCHQAGGAFSVLSTRPVRPAFAFQGNAAQQEAVKDMERRLASGASVPRALDCTSVHVMAQEDISAALSQARGQMTAGEASKDFSALLARAIPGAIDERQLSFPGYSNDRSVAVVYMSTYCGSACGDAGYYFFQRVGDRWQPGEYRVMTQ